ncbi:SMI1/KNR4 family protein [Actinophytocola gossypii]|uniref:SMI1/KNR4 family protein n=1 Tax=Actinophytocola gossypii TaxID=2812003 RepID=A0ABT2J529_9PSEU|nr:SMI1/KNR4 family protein [Actinophytocola gossypii]MCT2582967.1 SMI1/KNR4 family protein [Actinophytocola gossypii]
MAQLERVELEPLFVVTGPAGERDISLAEVELGQVIPADYKDLLRITDGLSSGGNLVLLGAADIVERNRDYEVAVYLPGHVMIGDDSGGTAILMRCGQSAVFEVDMGAMDMASLERSASSLRQLLVEFGGRTLGEREIVE